MCSMARCKVWSDVYSIYIYINIKILSSKLVNYEFRSIGLYVFCSKFHVLKFSNFHYRFNKLTYFCNKPEINF